MRKRGARDEPREGPEVVLLTMYAPPPCGYARIVCR